MKPVLTLRVWSERWPLAGAAKKSARLQQPLPETCLILCPGLERACRRHRIES